MVFVVAGMVYLVETPISPMLMNFSSSSWARVWPGLIRVNKKLSKINPSCFFRNKNEFKLTSS